MNRQLKWFLLGFLLTMAALGMAMTVHGPVTNAMMSELKINTAQRGLLITMQGVGTLISAFIWLKTGDRTNKAGLIGSGTLLIIISAIFLTAEFGYAGMMPFLMIYGFGFAIIDVMSNALVLDVFAKQKFVMFYLHAAVGIGAIAGSFLAAEITRQTNWQYSYLILAALTLIGFGIYVFSAVRAYPLMPYKDRKKETSRGFNFKQITKNKELWAIFLGSILFCTQEVGSLIWLPRYYESTLVLGPKIATIAVPVFYCGIVLSRFTMSILLKIFKIKTLLICGIAMASSSLFGLSFMQNIIGTVTLTVLAGFFTGSSYPLAVMLGNEYFPALSSMISATVFLGFTVSTMIMPYAMGALEIISPIGLRMSFRVIAVVTVLSAVCFMLLRPGKEKSSAMQSQVVKETFANS